MAAATWSASEVSRGWPEESVCWRRLKTSLGRRLRCSAVEKTLEPKISEPGWVRSVVPMAPPLALHWAARTFGWRVRVMDLGGNLRPRDGSLFIHMDKSRRRIFAIAPTTGGAGGRTLGDMSALSSGTNTMWVVVAACLVMFMQAGFAFLEIGFSRQKNAGTIIAKILTNFSICALVFWAVGFAFAFGNGKILGHEGFFLRPYGDQKAFGIMAFSDASVYSKFFFQFVFAAVSLAIVWGTTLERIKFGVYVIYAVVFSAVIYPIAAGWVFGGGWLQGKSGLGMQDFAGST